MSLFLRRLFACFILLSALAANTLAQSTAPQIPTDWDLLMLKLVNAARTDPAGENLLRGTAYTDGAVPPLAYDALVGAAAENHNRWMSAAGTPSHYETWGGELNDPLATGSPWFSGFRATQRLTFVGFSHSSWGENLLWGSADSEINASLIDANHVNWWTSAGHRSSLMNSAFTLLGHHAMNEFGFHWGMQNFARPSGAASNYLFGILYDDLNDSGVWEPHDAADPHREGLGGVAYQAYVAGTSLVVGGGVTFDNGGFSLRASDGDYDLEFALPGGANRWVRDLSLSGANLDVGDVAIDLPALPLAGDYDRSGQVDGGDFLLWQLELGSTVAAGEGADGTGDATVDGADLQLWRERVGSPISASGLVPEPASLAPAAIALLAWAQHRRRSAAAVTRPWRLASGTGAPALIRLFGKISDACGSSASH